MYLRECNIHLLFSKQKHTIQERFQEQRFGRWAPLELQCTMNMRQSCPERNIQFQELVQITFFRQLESSSNQNALRTSDRAMDCRIVYMGLYSEQNIAIQKLFQKKKIRWTTGEIAMYSVHPIQWYMYSMFQNELFHLNFWISNSGKTRWKVECSTILNELYKFVWVLNKFERQIKNHWMSTAIVRRNVWQEERFIELQCTVHNYSIGYWRYLIFQNIIFSVQEIIPERNDLVVPNFINFQCSVFFRFNIGFFFYFF